jgi:hypothetical protein
MLFSVLGPMQVRAVEPLAVSIDFPGGSGEVVGIDQMARSIALRPTRHTDRGWACWWSVRVSGTTPGETIKVTVGDAPWATPDRAAISDDGRAWKQTLAGDRVEKQITYSFVAAAPAMRIAWGPPWVQSDTEALVKSVAEKCSGAEAFELCRSPQGMAVWALRFSPTAELPDEQQHHGVWIQARQHAWESGASWVAQGLIEWLMSDDDRARRLRGIATIVIVPVMDVDNVELGAGGKNETPHDHNRDWTDKPHFPAVAAAQAEIKRLDGQGKFDLFLDLHNPGASAELPFFYAAPRRLLTERGTRNLDHFLAAAQADMTGKLAFKGEVHESDEKYDTRWQSIAKNWVTLHTGGHVVALTLETPWNTPDSTQNGYGCVGKNLGLAIERYLRAPTR